MPEIDPVILFAAFLAGLTNVGHCLGMCGPIVAAMSVNPQHQPSFGQTLGLNLAYNAGRLSSYVIAGGLAGGVGLLLVNNPAGHYVQYGLAVLAALVMLGLGLYLLNARAVFPWLEQAGAGVWRFVAPLARTFYPFNTPMRGYIAGMLWGWLPCGLVYTALIFAMTAAHPVLGSIYLLAFGLGTLPNLLAMGLAAVKLRHLVNHPVVRTVAALVVIGYAVVMLVVVIGDTGF
jgi:uncharacterized protein